MSSTPIFPMGTPVVILESPGTSPTLKGKTGYVRGARTVEGAQRQDEPRYLVGEHAVGVDVGWWTEVALGGLMSLAPFREDILRAERERVRAIPTAAPVGGSRDHTFVGG